MLVYLAGPIDHAKGQSWRNEAIKALGKDIACFDPHLAFANVTPASEKDVCRKVYNVNSYAIQMSDAVVLFAKPAPEVLMVGSWRELEIARSYKVPVCIVSDKTSVYMFDATVVSTLEEAVNWVKELVSSNEQSGARS